MLSTQRLKGYAALTKFFHLPLSEIRQMTIHEVNAYTEFMNEYLEAQNTNKTTSRETNVTRDPRKYLNRK